MARVGIELRITRCDIIFYHPAGNTWVGLRVTWCILSVHTYSIYVWVHIWAGCEARSRKHLKYLRTHDWCLRCETVAASIVSTESTTIFNALLRNVLQIPSPPHTHTHIHNYCPSHDLITQLLLITDLNTQASRPDSESKNTARERLVRSLQYHLWNSTRRMRNLIEIVCWRRL